MMGGGGFGGGQGRGKGGASGSGGVPPGGPFTAAAEAEEPLLRLYAEHAGAIAVRAAQVVLDAGLELADLHLAEPSLEDVFIHLTGKGLRD
jgi:ABC-2 type transport system ATP-binding protein